MNSLIKNNMLSCVVNQALSENILGNEYAHDIERAEYMLFYKKDEMIKLFNKSVPYFIYPVKEFKIIDISFTISDFGESYVHLYLNDGSYETLHVKNGKISFYSLTGTITIGNRVDGIKKVVNKSSDIFTSYFHILNCIMIKYPNRVINFGRTNNDFIESSLNSEKFIRGLYRNGR